MKKLLMAILILSITPLCSAPTEWSISHDDDNKIVVSVTDPPQEDIFLILAVDSSGILSDFVKGSDAPSDSFSAGTLTLNDYDMDFSSLGQGELWLMADWTTSEPVYNDGDWLTASFAFAAAGPSTVSLYEVAEDASYSLITSHTFIVPEPMTMALLGLGGLFLYRRK
jgi:hypothetical protein